MEMEMNNYMGIDNVVSLVRAVFWAAAFLFGVVHYIRLPAYIQLACIALLYILLSLNDERPDYFMDACKNHSTAAACTNFGRCEIVRETFDIDEEWAVYRRNKCIEGMPTDKARLYNSYNPARCASWGDCSGECTAKLTEIRAEIDSYECPAGGEHKDVLSSLDDFPLANSAVLRLFPFNYDGVAQLWGWLAVGLCIILMAKRASTIYTR